MIRSDVKGNGAATGVMEPELEQEIAEQVVEQKVAEPFHYREKATAAKDSAATHPHSAEWLPVDDEC